jgi:hypothetical protein
LIDQVECHDQTALPRAPRNDESLSVRVDVVHCASKGPVVGILKQHVASSDRYVGTRRQPLCDQLPLGIPVEELLPIRSPDWVSPAAGGNQPLVSGLREGLYVYFELTGLV